MKMAEALVFRRRGSMDGPIWKKIYLHLEDGRFIFFVGLYLYLLCELDDRLKMRIILVFLLQSKGRYQFSFAPKSRHTISWL